jgi:predicted Zn-dependent protease
MGHLKAQMGNRFLGALLDGILAAATRTPSTGAFSNSMGAAFSQDFEAEADYVGLYIMARAELPIKDAPKFWRRMAAEVPSSIAGSGSATHPATSYRMLALDKTVTEIEQKRVASQSLTPQLKGTAAK